MSAVQEGETSQSWSAFLGQTQPGKVNQIKPFGVGPKLGEPGRFSSRGEIHPIGGKPLNPGRRQNIRPQRIGSDLAPKGVKPGTIRTFRGTSVRCTTRNTTVRFRGGTFIADFQLRASGAQGVPNPGSPEHKTPRGGSRETQGCATKTCGGKTGGRQLPAGKLLARLAETLTPNGALAKQGYAQFRGPALPC